MITSLAVQFWLDDKKNITINIKDNLVVVVPNAPMKTRSCADKNWLLCGILTFLLVYLCSSFWPIRKRYFSNKFSFRGARFFFFGGRGARLFKRDPITKYAL